MKLSEIYAAVEAGEQLNGDRAFATLVAIDQLAGIEGVPISALCFSAPAFAQRYPLHGVPMPNHWMGPPQYRVWRKAILDAQMFFAPGDVDGNPWTSLMRSEKLGANKIVSTLYEFRNRLPAGTSPQEVTYTLVLATFNELPEAQAKRFRASFTSFRRLFDNDLARRSGLLPQEKPASLPTERDHFRLVDMAPGIRSWRSNLSSRKVVNALDYINRLGVTGGCLNGKTDTLEDLRGCLPDLPDPSSIGVPPISAVVLRGYIKQLVRSLGGPDPFKTSAEQAWHELVAAARNAGCKTSEIWSIGKPAAARGILPSLITAADVEDIMQSYKVSSMPTLCRKGCVQFDTLRGIVPDSTLPPEPLRIRHVPRHVAARCRKPTSAMLARQRANREWEELYAAIRSLGWSSRKIGATFSPLRARCVEQNYTPWDLTQASYRAIEACASGTKRLGLRNAARHLRALGRLDRRFAPFLEALPEITRRQTHGGVPEGCAEELAELLDFMNVAMSTRRSYRVAVAVAADALGRPDITLADLLHTDMSAFDLGSHEPRRSTHMGKLRSLREFRELPWTKTWRDLQSVVVASGIGAKDNPVPKVLSWRPGPEPSGVSLVWAQKLDRELRSTINHPPHGRADIANTLARHLSAFDKLHEMPKVAGSGLLPPRIGSLR